MTVAVLKRVVGLLVLAVLVLAWQIASTRGVLNPLYFPAPTKLLSRLSDAGTRRNLFDGLRSTLRLSLIAYLLAVVIGTPIGLLMGFSTWFHAALDPLVEVLRPIPAPVYVPLLILIMGIGNGMVATVAALAAVFPIIINSAAGVRSINPALRETARLLSFSRTEELVKVVAPSSLRGILTGMRISLSVALLVTVVAEMISPGAAGLGHLIVDAQRSFRTELMYLGIIVLGVTGYLLNQAFVVGERAVLRRWDPGSAAGSAGRLRALFDRLPNPSSRDRSRPTQ